MALRFWGPWTNISINYTKQNRPWVARRPVLTPLGGWKSDESLRHIVKNGYQDVPVQEQYIFK